MIKYSIYKLLFNQFPGEKIMSIKPEYFTLSQLLNNRLFKIPSYQRAYSWRKKQRLDLFSDIEKIHNCGDNNRHHFMATIVCLDTNEKEEVGTDELANLDVVDGQQRVTTLIILLKALSKELHLGDENEIREAHELEKVLVKDDQRLILLQTNHDSSHIFRNYLVHGTIPQKKEIATLAEENLINAFNDCEQFVKRWRKESTLFQLLKILKNRLDFIFYVLQDEGAVYTVFEVLNSRGLSVDWLDKCKSILMGIVYEKAKPAAKDLIGEIHKYWTQIYRIIGLRNFSGDEIVKYTATIWHLEEKRKVLSAEESVEFFRQYCSKVPKRVIDISSRILEVTKRLNELYENERTQAVTEISHARLLAVSVMVAEHLSEEDRKKVLEQWERVTFRIFGMFGKDSRHCVGEYTSLAHKIIRKKLSKDDIIYELKKIGRKYPIDTALLELTEEDCYHNWTHELRYFLYRYEEHLAKKANARTSNEVWEKIWHASPDHSIEHVLPQEYKQNLDWAKINNAENHIHRLGNLGILAPGENSRAGNKNFESKIKIYEDNNLRLMKEIINYGKWDLSTIEDRERKLLDWARTEWDDIED
jgi:hypothetical protein